MNYGFVRVGAFTPKIKVADTQANTAEIKKLIDQAEKEHTALAVFPELCITGYTCGDLFLQSRLLNSSREALEELAVQLACEKITQEELEELEKAGENFKKVLKRSKDITEVAEADVRFHDVIYMATDNQKLIHLLNKLREQMYRYRVEYLKNPDVHEQLTQEHEEIVYHIKRREKVEATAVTCQHIDNQVSAVTDKIRTKNN